LASTTGALVTVDMAASVVDGVGALVVCGVRGGMSVCQLRKLCFGLRQQLGGG